MRIRFSLFVFIFLWLWATLAAADGQRPVSDPGPGKVFLYTGKKFGIPILKASLQIENGQSRQGKIMYQVHLEVSSVKWGFLFRMNNRFTSTLEADTCMPVQYVKEIDQEGLFKGKKYYQQILTFDSYHHKVVVEKKGEKEKQEITIPPQTFDPLSMFARWYLKEGLQLHQEIRMSIFDGVKLRQLVFQPKQEKIKSKIYGEVEAVCLESTTSFVSFDNKEGVIRIWYTNDGKRTPILMELGLPVGDIRFELDEIKEGRENRPSEGAGRVGSNLNPLSILSHRTASSGHQDPAQHHQAAQGLPGPDSLL